MDLIDRYLAAVRRHLPKQTQDDIVRELSDNLRSEAEEREQAAGHALSNEEQAVLLKKHGHPWLMASKYLPQQHLIGPALFPYYRQALTIAVFWIVLPIALFGGALAMLYSDSPAHAFSQAWSRVLSAAWNGAIYAVGIVTIIFAVLEHERVRFTALENWNPSKLPDIDAGRHVPRSETLPSLVAMLTFLVWWIGILPTPPMTQYVGVSVRFVAAPIWDAVYLPVLIAVVASIAVGLVDLVRPWRTVTVSVADIVANLLNAVVIGFLIQARHYVSVIGDPRFGDRLTRADYWINASLTWTFMVIGAVVLFDVLYELWRIVRRTNVKLPTSARAF